MIKKLIVGSLLGLCLIGTASADDKADAQKKVDAAKTETCEKTKKFIAEQNAKGRCKDEHAAAQKITCSASTFKDMIDLNTRCMKAPPAKDDSAKPDDKAAAAGGTKCRAMIDGKAVAEADDSSSVKCSTKLMEAVRLAKCTTADMKGKKVEYVVNHDHKIGKNTIKDRPTALTCVRITPAK